MTRDATARVDSVDSSTAYVLREEYLVVLASAIAPAARMTNDRQPLRRERSRGRICRMQCEKAVIARITTVRKIIAYAMQLVSSATPASATVMTATTMRGHHRYLKAS